MEQIDNFYLSKHEPLRSCLIALKTIILNSDPGLTEAWKYGMPFFCLNGKMLCYLWVDKKQNKPYLGIVDGNKIKHPKLLQEKRSRMKIMLFEPDKDLPVKDITFVLQQAVAIKREKGFS